MSKIYEALEKASKERKERTELTLIPHLPEGPAETPTMGMLEEMLSLYKNIESTLSHSSKKIIQFIGSREGEGVSTISRDFARVLADKIGKRVLLVDTDRIHSPQGHYFDMGTLKGWQESITEGRVVIDAVHQVGQSTLFVCCSSNGSCHTHEIFDSSTLEKFWDPLGQQFDFILIDSPPLSTSPDGLALASRVDGIVLVLEAEKTRWQVVKDLKTKIEKVGGHILGVVLNKRRYHIPQTLYKKL